MIERYKMLNIKFFESFVKTFGGSSGFKGSDADLMAWARTEYKNDAAWAFSYMKRTGGIPPEGSRYVNQMAV